MKSKHKSKVSTLKSFLNQQIGKGKKRHAYEKEKGKLFLGYQIALARQRVKMTQSELAMRLGTRQSNISRLEKGNYNFTVDMLEKIAEALGAKVVIRFIESKAA